MKPQICPIKKKRVFELNVSCFVDDCVNNWRGQKRKHQGCIQLDPRFAKLNNGEESAMSIFNHSVDYCPILCVTFLCARLKAFISILKIACCAAFEEPLCV